MITNAITSPASTDQIHALARELGGWFEVRAIDGEADEHGMACGWCETGDPVIVNVYYSFTEGGHFYEETDSTCANPACITKATEDHTSDADVIVEVSMAPVVPSQRATASDDVDPVGAVAVGW